MLKEADIIDKTTAAEAFKALIAQYGLRWTAKVPGYAYELLAVCNRYLDEGDRREALGFRR